MTLLGLSNPMSSEALLERAEQPFKLRLMAQGCQVHATCCFQSTKALSRLPCQSHVVVEVL